MEVFFDTEFTTADKNVGFPALISVGCAAQGGETFYAEISDTWHSGICSPFVIEYVLPLLEGGGYAMTEAQLAINLKEWIEGLTEKKVTLRTDAPRYDWPWIEQLFTFYGCWPQNLRRTYGTVYFDHDYQEKRYMEHLDAYWKEHAVPLPCPAESTLASRFARRESAQGWMACMDGVQKLIIFWDFDSYARQGALTWR